MAAISIAINRGVEGFRISDFTVGTAAPSASTDMEFRWNTTDQSGSPTPQNTITRLDLLKALDAFKRAIETDAFLVNPLGI
jgi:hypothetical protein